MASVTTLLSVQPLHSLTAQSPDGSASSLKRLDGVSAKAVWSDLSWPRFDSIRYDPFIRVFAELKADNVLAVSR